MLDNKTNYHTFAYKNTQDPETTQLNKCCCKSPFIKNQYKELGTSEACTSS